MKTASDKIDIVCGDITNLDVDAIVNAANTTLLGGGGVSCGAYRYPIERAAKVAVETTRAIEHNDKIDKLLFVLASDEIVAAYQQALRERP